MSERLTADEALQALNQLRSNVIATQNASWSNTMYPLVAILNAAGLELTESTDEQKREHLNCYDGAGGYPFKESLAARSPSRTERGGNNECAGNP